MQYVIGPFEGWWLQSDGRDAPFIEPVEWDKRLRSAGFSGCDSVTMDYEKPYTYMAYMVARPAIEEPAPERVTLLHGSQKIDFVAKVEEVLRARSIAFDTVQWGHDLPADQDIISFVDLRDEILLRDISSENLERLSRLIDEFQGLNMLWLMPPAQTKCTEPYAGQMVGLLRTVRSELAASFATLELDDTEAEASRAIVDVLKTICSSNDDDDVLDVDMEWAWSNGALNVSRFHWIQLDEDLCATAKAPTSKSLSIRIPGLLHTLEWTAQSVEEPAPGEVQIKIAMAGLSQYDVQKAQGIDSSEKNVFGQGGVGRITKLGPNVNGFKIGDRVLTVGSESSTLAMVINRPSQLVVKVPKQMSDEEAATMPLVYIAALIFLVEKWKLEKDQTILIHNAASGKNSVFFFNLFTC